MISTSIFAKLPCARQDSLVTGLGGVNLVQGAESTLGPDDEPADVTTGGQLQQVQGGDGAGLDTGNVPQGLDDTLVVLVDDQRSSPLPVPPVPHLSLSGPDLPRVGDLDNVRVGLDGLQELDGLLGLLERLGRVGQDKGNLLDLLDSVSSGEDQRGKGRSSQSRGDGVSSLVLVDLQIAHHEDSHQPHPSLPLCSPLPRLTLTCHFLKVLVGANILPPLHMFPKAPCPALAVPLPAIRGIRATARPVPQDSAECW